MLRNLRSLLVHVEKRGIFGALNVCSVERHLIVQGSRPGPRLVPQYFNHKHGVWSQPFHGGEQIIGVRAIKLHKERNP